MRARRMQAGGPKPGGPSQSPHKRPERRPRRNSDSSLLIDIEKPLTEEDIKQREARRREREKRNRQHRPNRRVDVIDQLDATSMFGIGGKLVPDPSPFFSLFCINKRRVSKSILGGSPRRVSAISRS